MSTPFDDALLLARRAVAAACGLAPPGSDAAAARAVARLERFAEARRPSAADRLEAARYRDHAGQVHRRAKEGADGHNAATGSATGHLAFGPHWGFDMAAVHRAAADALDPPAEHAERAGFEDEDTRPTPRPEPPEPPPSSWDRSRDKFLRDAGNLRPRPDAQAAGHAEAGDGLRRQRDEDKEAGKRYRRTQEREGTRQADREVWREMMRRQYEDGRRARDAEGYGEEEYGRRTTDDDFDIDPADADRSARWHDSPEYNLDLYNRVMSRGTGPVSPYPERRSRLQGAHTVLNTRLRDAAPPTHGSDTDWYVPTEDHAEVPVSLLTARRGRRYGEAEDYEALRARGEGAEYVPGPPLRHSGRSATDNFSKEQIDDISYRFDRNALPADAEDARLGWISPELAASYARSLRGWGYGQPADEEFYETSQARREDGKWTAGANRAGRGRPGEDEDGDGDGGDGAGRRPQRVRDEAGRAKRMGLVGVPPEPRDIAAHVADTIDAALALARAARDGTLRNADAAAALALSRLGAARKAARDNGLDEVDSVLAELTEEAAGLADSVRAGTNDAEVRDRLRQLAGEADGAVRAAMGGGEEFGEEGVDDEEEHDRLMDTMRHFGGMYRQTRDRLRQEAQEDWNRSVASDAGGGGKDNRRPGYQRQNRRPRTPPPMMDRDLYPRRDSGYAEGDDDGSGEEYARLRRIASGQEGEPGIDRLERIGAHGRAREGRRAYERISKMGRGVHVTDRRGRELSHAEGDRLPPVSPGRLAQILDDAEHADFTARINDDPKDLERERIGRFEGKGYAHEYANDADSYRRDYRRLGGGR